MVFNAQRIALAGIRGYQQFLAPVAVNMGMRCRFSPSCSVYAETVIERDGVVAGGWKSLLRIARCGPWTPMGTTDTP